MKFRDHARYQSFLWYISICSSTCCVTAQTESRTLRWNLKPGEELTAVLNQDTEIQTKLNNRSQEISNQMLLAMDWLVQESTDEKFVIKQTIRRIRLIINAPGKGGVKITTLDTDESQSPNEELAVELLKQIQPLIGTEYSVAMNPRGEILDVEIPEQSMQAIREAPASMQIRQVLTKEGLSDLFGQSAIVFPEKSLSAGDTWIDQTEIKNEVGTIKKSTNFEYVGLTEEAGGRFDMIQATTNATLNSESPDTSLEGFSGKGTIRFAAEESNNILKSEWGNQLTTRRQYRDKTIFSTVTTNISLSVNRN